MGVSIPLQSRPASRSTPPGDPVALSIHGMTCAGCVATVENALRAVPGVESAEVNLATEEGRVWFRGGGDDLPALIRAVEGAGYRAAARAPTHRLDRERARRDEERANRRRLLLAAACALPLMAIEMTARGAPWARALELLLATPVVFVAAWTFHARAARAARHGVWDMNTLISLGTLAAYFGSVAMMLWPGAGHDPAGGGHLYFDTAVMILVFILLGRLLESRARRRTGEALRALLTRRPATARRLGATGDRDAESVPVESLRRDDRIELLPGETVPVDGLVEEGRTEVDESMLTGEPLPVFRGPGDPLAAGTINRVGRIVLRATRVGEASTLARIVRLVEEAQGSKAPIQALVDRVAGRFVPFVLAAAGLSAILWLALGPPPAPRYAMLAFVSVLIIACPCAMGLATPTALVAGMGAGARRGILIRSGEALERARALTTLVFDKTGTLTRGEPRVAARHAAGGVDPARLLRLAAAVEAGSEHPLARAVVRFAEGAGVPAAPARDVSAVPGEGARGAVDGMEVRAGSRAFAAAHAAEPLLRAAEEAAERGRTVVWVSEADATLGFLEVEDPEREEAAAAVARLRERGLALVLATGDRQGPAVRLARSVGIEDVRAGLTPEGKVALIRSLQAEGAVVGMVGDGLNDAAALAASDLGIALGSGTDVAVEAADVALLGGGVGALVDALELSARTLRTIRQNLFWAFAYNVIAIPIAAGALYPSTGLLLHPTIASAAMALSSVSVVANSVRLGRWNGR